MAGISIEDAVAAAKKREQPQIEFVQNLVIESIRDSFMVDLPLVVDIPKSHKRGRATYDIRKFIVEGALEDFTKPSETGSYWGVQIDDVPAAEEEPAKWRVTLTAKIAPVASHP